MSKKAKQKELLTKTIPSLRVTDKVYEFYQRKQEVERRDNLTEAVRRALEDYATEHAGDIIAV